MFDLIASILDLFYQWTSSYGLSIIMLTLLAMIVVLPFTLKGTRSMIEMQRMQPELKKIQTRYKDDRQKQNEEVMKFYQENNINPLGGCLPMFIQLPVFLVLFQILRGLTRRATSIGEFIGGAANIGTNLPVFDGRTRVFNPAYLSEDSELRLALEGDTEMNFLGLDLAPSTSEMVSRGVTSAFPYVILILVVFATGWIQHKQIQGRASAAAANPQQQTIMKIMPFILPVISYTLPAAMLLYFVVSNVFRIAQQSYITRNIYGNEPRDVVVAAEPKKSSQKSGGQKKAPAKQNTSGKQKSSNTRSTSSKGSGTSTSAKGRRTKAGPRPSSSNQQSKGQPGRTASGGRTTEPGTVSPRARKKKR